MTISHDVLKRAEMCFASGIAPSEFDLRQFSRDAEKLTRLQPGYAALVRAAVAGLRWDIELVRRETSYACTIDGSVDSRASAAMAFM